MDHVTRLAQALRYDDTQTLQQSELREMTADELMSYIGRKDRPIESEKIASAEMSPEEKFKLADKWGREFAKTAGAVGDAAKVVVGKALRAAKGASKSTGRRAAVGAAAGAAGSAATELSKKDPSRKGVAKGVVTGALAGGALGAVAKPTAQKIVKMKGPVGDFARKSVNKSRMYDFVQAVKKPFTKTSMKKDTKEELALIGAGGVAGGVAGNRIAKRATKNLFNSGSFSAKKKFVEEAAAKFGKGGARKMIRSVGRSATVAGVGAGSLLGEAVHVTRQMKKEKAAGILGTIGTAAKGFAMRHPVQAASTAVGALGGAVGGGAMAGQGKRVGGAVGGGIAGAAAGYAAPNIVKRISQMAGSKINRQGAGTMAKMLPAGRAGQQTINATRI